MKVSREQYERCEDYKFTFESAPGKRVLDDLRKAFDQQSYKGDPHETAFACGQRDVYLRVLRLLEVAKNPHLEIEDEPQES